MDSAKMFCIFVERNTEKQMIKRLLTIFTIAFASVTMTGAIAAVSPSGGDTQSSVTVATTAPSVKSGAGHIELTVNDDEATTFYIYSITGQLIKTVTVTSAGTVSVELHRGYYIVKCAKWSKQAVVK